MCLKIEGKVCLICKTFKEFSEFPVKSDRKDGHYHQCKECRNRLEREKYLKIKQETYKFDSLYKTCPHCKQEKFIYDFSWKNKSKGLFNSLCKECVKEKYYTGEQKEKSILRAKQYRLENKDKIKEYNSRPEVIEANARYKTKPEVIERYKEYNSRPDVIERKREYASRPEIKKRIAEYVKKYSQTEEYKQKSIVYEQNRRNKRLNERLKNGAQIGDYVFYILKFWFKEAPEEYFYKIGITSQSIKVRYLGYSDFTYEVIKELYFEEKLCKALEQKLIFEHKRLNLQYTFTRDVYFRGYTECFKELDKTILHNVLGCVTSETTRLISEA